MLAVAAGWLAWSGVANVGTSPRDIARGIPWYASTPDALLIVRDRHVDRYRWEGFRSDVKLRRHRAHHDIVLTWIGRGTESPRKVVLRSVADGAALVRALEARVQARPLPAAASSEAGKTTPK